ncbi:MAG: helix-turn-helix domain-containing protein [Bacteroidales bacterium]|nr:helix-turn-helix domain-containing protein [Bacteroidales bacterium]
MEGDSFSERLHAALKARGETGAWLARQIGISTANISRYTSGNSYPQALKYLTQISVALRVSTDYLLGVTDIIDPLPKNEETVKDFEDRYSHLFQDEDFLTCVKVYNALSDEDRMCMTAIVKEYGVNRNALKTDEKPITSGKTEDNK